MKELLTIVRTLSALDVPGAVLATLVKVEGSSYRRPGARLLVIPDGSRIGSISGGCLEEDVLVRAARVAASGKPEVVVYDTTSENDLVWGVGLGCHGIVRVLIERLPIRPAWALALAEGFRNRRSEALIVGYEHSDQTRLGTRIADAKEPARDGTFVQCVPPPTKLVIFGAGNDAQPLARLGNELGWTITVADPRPSFATVDRFPMADSVIAAAASDLVGQAGLDTHSAAVVMTHHYVHDVPILRALVGGPARYVGLLGPRKRAEKIMADLATEGITLTAEQQSRLHAPVGLDLGADGPEQVALAIAAEIQATLGGRDGRALRERLRPIHE